jgi:hypothetical protein
MFNVVDHASGWKVDFMIRKNRDFSREEFARRMKQSGGSERQRRDVAGVLATVGQELDRAYVERWVGNLDLLDEWFAAQKTAV